MNLADTSLTFDSVLTLSCFFAVGYGALHDVAVRTVPNTVCSVTGLLGLAHAAIHHTLVVASITAMIVLLFGTLLWRASLLGAGDIKLIAVSSLWVGPVHVPALLACTTIFGGLLACLYLALSTFLPGPAVRRPEHLARRIWRVELRRIGRRASLPYAVAIACATIFCTLQR